MWHSLQGKQQNQEAWQVLNKVDARALNGVLSIEIPDVNDVV
jgi:hypothetical protein